MGAGALNQTIAVPFRRHHPERGILYQTIEAYWPIFVSEQAKVGKSFPIFIHEEFEKFLECGVPEHGFIRTYCHQCRVSGIVAFSCKKRGFCPSCTARRMNDEAAHLVDRVIPLVMTRQWVLSFPYKLRFLMAHNPKLTNKALAVFIGTISAFYKKKAKKCGILKAIPGSVTFVQRFGSALNLNVHFHTLFTDGVFYKVGDGYEFYRIQAPSQEELHFLAEKIQKKIFKVIEKLGLNDRDQIWLDENILGEVSSMSITHKAGFGERAGNGLKRYGIKRIEVDPEDNDPMSCNVGGFSLNARVWIAGGERKKLEQLIRYMARGPIATKRLTRSFSNHLLYKMKTPWRDGTTHVSFSPLDFIARLVALIPPPKVNLVRYHGVFAPNFRDRKFVVLKPRPEKNLESPEATSASGDSHKGVRRERLRWSEMLKRTFEIDVTVCLKCNGHLEQIAIIKDRVVAKAILASLMETTEFRPLEIVRERGPPETGGLAFDEFDQRGSW